MLSFRHFAIRNHARPGRWEEHTSCERLVPRCCQRCRQPSELVNSEEDLPHDYSDRRGIPLVGHQDPSTCAVGLTVSYSPFGSSVYTPGISEVMAEFEVSREVALLPFTLYILGLSFGPVIVGTYHRSIATFVQLTETAPQAAPVSETFGRRVVYMSALPIFGIFTIGAGFSKNITSLAVCRFLAGLSSSPGLSLGPGTMADMFLPHERALPMAIYVTAVQMGPALGPLVSY